MIGEGTAEIRGRVLDATSKQPIADLEVLLFEVDAGGVPGPGPRPRSRVTHTDAAGGFSVSGISTGSYQVRVTGKTHLPTCFGGSPETPERCQRIRVDVDQIQRDVVILARPAGIISGRYLLHALGSADGKQDAGFRQVDVSDGNTEVSLQLEEAGLITGRIIAEQGGVPPLETGGISAWWVLDDDVVGAVRVEVSADGAFTFGDVFGDRIFKVGLAAGWRVVSVRADGKDVTDDVLHIAPGSRIQVTITVGRR